MFLGVHSSMLPGCRSMYVVPYVCFYVTWMQVYVCGSICVVLCYLDALEVVEQQVLAALF